MANAFPDASGGMMLPEMEQNALEFEAFLAILDGIKPTSILEIGTFQGGTLFRFCEQFPEAHIAAIDPRPMIVDSTRGMMSEYILHIGCSQDPRIRQRVIADNGGRFDVIFIDGDHTYPSAKEDWVWAKEWASKLVVFHDVASIGNPSIEVRKLWEEIKAEFPNRTTDICFEKDRNGIGIYWVPE